MATEARVTAVIEAKDETSGVLDTIGKSFGKFNTSALAIGGALTAAGGAMVKIANDVADFNQWIARAGANVDATTEQLAQFRQVAIDATKDTNFNAEQAASALYQLAGGSISATDAMEGLQQAIKFAQANGIEDLDESVMTVANVMTLFKLRGNEAARAMDVLTVAGHEAFGTTQDLISAFKEVAPIAAQLGISIEETAGLISGLADAGIKGTEAGVAMKRALEQLISPTGAAKDNLERLGIKTSDTKGNFVGLNNVLDQLQKKLENTTPMERATVLSQTFGQIAGPAMTALLNSGAEARQGYIDDMGQAAGATDKAANSINKATNPVNELHNRFFELETKLAVGVVPVLSALIPIVDMLSALIGGVFAVTVGALGDAFYGVWMAAKAVSDFFTGTFKSAIDIAKGALAELQFIAERVGSAINSVINTAKSIGGKVSSAVKSVVPSFDVGGYVPGAIGAPMLAVVHGGEYVVPNGGGATGRGGGTGITINITGNNISSALDIRNLAEQVGKEVMRSLRMAQQI